MLDLQVVPERSIGTDQWEIALGMPLFQVINVLKKEFPTIEDVKFNYDEWKPFDEELVLKLPADGLRFVINPIYQRLNRIEVFDMSLVKLKYCGNYFNAPQIQPTSAQINEVFGATQPAQTDSQMKMDYLAFRGINFYFPVVEHVSNGDKTLDRASKNVVRKMIIYAGNSLKKNSIPPKMPMSCYHSNLFSESTTVMFNGDSVEGLKMNIESVGTDTEMRMKCESMPCKVKFGDKVQDVLSTIGSPCRFFFKSDDKMSIHLPHSERNKPRYSDYFFNYITLGMDLLFDGSSHTVKKFILHTNHPSHYNFNIYYRSNFNIILPGKKSHYTPLTQWTDILTSLGGNNMLDLPVSLQRSSSVNNTNPFGHTLCYGLYNMIFEVMKNGYVASVVLYQEFS